MDTFFRLCCIVGLYRLLLCHFTTLRLEISSLINQCMQITQNSVISCFALIILALLLSILGIDLQASYSKPAFPSPVALLSSSQNANMPSKLSSFLKESKRNFFDALRSKQVSNWVLCMGNESGGKLSKSS